MFNSKLIAEASAFQHGCALHCLIDCLVINIQKDKINMKEADEGLTLLLAEFRKYYQPHANELTKQELWKILKEEMGDPVHRTRVLGPVFRQMLESEDQRVPGTFVTDQEVQKLGNKFNIWVKSFGTLRAQFVAENGRQPASDAELESFIRQMAIARIKNNMGNSYTPTEDEILVRIKKLKDEFHQRDALRGTDQTADIDAVELVLLNQHGGHWERLYNHEEEEEDNIAECKAHNEAYHARRHILLENAHLKAGKEIVCDYLRERRNPQVRPLADRLNDYERLAIRHAEAVREVSPPEARAANQGPSVPVSPNNPFPVFQNIFQGLGKYFENDANTSTSGPGLSGFFWFAVWLDWAIIRLW